MANRQRIQFFKSAFQISISLISFFFIGCTNSSPSIVQLGSISDKFSIDNYTQEVFDVDEEIALAGTCENDVERLEIKNDSGQYVDIKSFKCSDNSSCASVTCSVDKKFSLRILKQSSIFGSNTGGTIVMRGFTKAYEIEPVSITISDKSATQVPPISFDSMAILSSVRSVTAFQILKNSPYSYSDAQIDLLSTRPLEKTRTYFSNANKIAFSGLCKSSDYQFKVQYKRDNDSSWSDPSALSGWQNCIDGKFAYPSNPESNGNWSVESNHKYIFSVVQKKPSSNKGESNPVFFEFYIDDSQPSTITKVSPIDTANAGGGVHKNSSVTFEGTCEYNANFPTVIEVKGDRIASEAQFLNCASNGKFSFTTSTSRSPATLNYQFVQSDIVGNSSVTSGDFRWVYDTSPPGSVTVTIPSSYSSVSVNSSSTGSTNITGGSNSISTDGSYLTNNPRHFYSRTNKVTLTGTCTNYFGIKATIGSTSTTATCSAAGSYTITTPDATAGLTPNQVDVVQIDFAGNSSTVPTTVFHNYHNSKPARFTSLKSIADINGNTGVLLVNAPNAQNDYSYYVVTNSMFSGGLPISHNSGAWGNQITFHDGTSTSRTSVSSTSIFSFPNQNPSDGTHTYTLKQLDVASSGDNDATLLSDHVKINWYKDTSAPSIPSISSSSSPNSNLTSVTVTGNCSYSTLTINPEGNTPYYNKVTKVTYTYKIDSGSTVQSANSVDCQSNGTFSFTYNYNEANGTPALTNNSGSSNDFQTHELRIRQIDPFENESLPATVTWTRKNHIDTPTINGISASTGDSKTITGTCEYIAGKTTTINLTGSFGGYSANASTTCASNGTYSLNYTPNSTYLNADIGNGNGYTDDDGDIHSISVSQTDFIGNVSTSATSNWTRDNWADTPTISNLVGEKLPNSAFANLMGNCEAGGSYSVTRTGASAGDTSIICTGSTIDAFIFGEVKAGLYSLSIKKIDALGNESTSTSPISWFKEGRLSTFHEHTCTIDSSNNLSCWGADNFGQRGDGGNSTSSGTVSPIATTGGSEATANNFYYVSAGRSHTCAIADNNTLLCWGLNSAGQLGINSTTNQDLPKKVRDSSGNIITTQFAQVSAGGAHTCAITTDFKLFCWGENASGQLGIGNTTDSDSPTAVDSGNDYVYVSSGSNHTCAIRKATKQLRCWGANASSQLGDGTTTQRNSRVPVDGTNTYSSISAGNTHTCGVRTNGDLYCWGSDSNEVLGNGASGSQTTPDYIAGGYLTSSVGSKYGCSSNSNREIYCWGNNSHLFIQDIDDDNQNDDGEPTSISSPYQMYVAAGVYSISLGKEISSSISHFCYTNSLNDVRCWGDNNEYKAGGANSSTDYSITSRFTVINIGP